MATTEQDLRELLRNNPPANKFVPYCYLCKKTDTLTAYFEADPDYSVRLNEHLTVYRSLDTNEIVGCRVKGVAGIVADLPNYVRVKGNDGEIELSIIFLAFRGNIEGEEERVAVNDLGKAATEKQISFDRGALA